MQQNLFIEAVFLLDRFLRDRILTWNTIEESLDFDNIIFIIPNVNIRKYFFAKLSIIINISLW